MVATVWIASAACGSRAGQTWQAQTHDRPVAWLPDGRIVVERRSIRVSGDASDAGDCGETGLYSVRPDGSRLEALLTGSRGCSLLQRARTIAVTESGRTIVYGSRGNARVELHLAGFEASADTVLSAGCDMNDETFAMQPRAEAVLFFADCETPRRGRAAYRVDLQTRVRQRLEPLAGEGAAEFPSLSPKGDSLVFVTRDPTSGPETAYHVNVAALGNGPERPLVRGRYPVWSPTGEWVAYLSPAPSSNPAGWSIRLVHADGTGDHAIDSLPPRKDSIHTGSVGTPEWPLVWSPDGKQLAFASLYPGGSSLWSVEIATGRRKQLTQVTGDHSR